MTKNKIKKALQALGNTPDEVAEHLEQEGITGTRYEATFCPIAHYVNTVPSVQKASAGRQRVYAYKGRRIYEISMPGPCKEFISRFDGGYYPRLISN